MKFEVTEADCFALCRQAPEFLPVVEQVGPLEGFECIGDLFYALVQSIISQQLAVKAAAAIFQRVEIHLGKITAESLLSAAFDDLRSCGLSGRKIEYLRGIADAKISGTIDFESLAMLPDAEVIKELVKLKGVGVWTAEMLLLFALGRPDVLSFHDLGIRRGIILLNGLAQLSAREFEYFRRRYAPYGSLASLYLWQMKDGGLCVR